MRVAGLIYASAELMREMDEKVLTQIGNVATLPGVMLASYAMPDAHSGYGFPIGGVAAFDADGGGVVSAGGVGFDISCGVRTLRTGLTRDQVIPVQQGLVDALFKAIPSGVGAGDRLHLPIAEIDAILEEGARWAIRSGYGIREDLAHIEDQGCVAGADPREVSPLAKKRQQGEMGTLGSGNHYLEVQEVVKIYDPATAQVFGLKQGDILVSIHCGSRGLGHQVATDFSRLMTEAAKQLNLRLPDPELASIPAETPVGQAYLKAMRGAINCALANRQIITHFVREVFDTLLPKSCLSLLYDVSHNTCKEEIHRIDGRPRRLLVHRKGATRALGPHHAELPPAFQAVGQPVLIGGSMGGASYILAGQADARQERRADQPSPAFGSVCHGAGRRMSRQQAAKNWNGREMIQQLEASQGILVRSRSMRGLAEEAPGAYKDVEQVVTVAERAGLARRVARVKPLICIKG